MSITDELRKWLKSLYTPNSATVKDEGERIADHIDAVHQKALDEWKAEHGQMWLKGYSECHAELLEGNETLASDLEGCGWIRLPKDADGEPIHVGDVMEWVRYKDGDQTIVRTVSGIGNGVFFAWSDEQGRYAQYEAHAHRHHHAPTVEDVLREFADEVYADADNEIRDRDFLCAKYAKRLTLAETEDA